MAETGQDGVGCHAGLDVPSTRVLGRSALATPTTMATIHAGEGPCLVGTLGMFILDQFRFEDEETGKDLGDGGLGWQIGGGGTYFAVGARMWLHPSAVLMTVDRGADFSGKEQAALDHYSLPCLDNRHSLWRYRDRKEQTTRAVNVYRGQQRGFDYLTPKLRLEPADLLWDSSPTFPPFIHCICSPERAADICDQIDNATEHWRSGQRPHIIWEPIPDSAVPGNLKACLAVMARVDVISPNHEEAASFLSVAKSDLQRDDARSTIKTLLLDALYMHASNAGIGKMPVVCIRSGALGALVGVNMEQTAWVEAYHRPADVDRVIDVTGAGNAWLGGFTAGLALRGQGGAVGWTLEDVTHAAQLGSVSASFVVEQHSLPVLSFACPDEERWNNESAATRLQSLKSR